MENNGVCDSDNHSTSNENTSLNEATPVVLSPSVSDSSLNRNNSNFKDVVECDNVISSTTPDKYIEESTSCTSVDLIELGVNSETEADFFSSELNISNIPTGKISENVEDIVQDLENLLGESSDSYRFTRESFDNSKQAESCDEINSSNIDEDVQDTQLQLDDVFQTPTDLLPLNLDESSTIEDAEIISAVAGIEEELREASENTNEVNESQTAEILIEEPDESVVSESLQNETEANYQNIVALPVTNEETSDEVLKTEQTLIVSENSTIIEDEHNVEEPISAVVEQTVAVIDLEKTNGEDSTIQDKLVCETIESMANEATVLIPQTEMGETYGSSVTNSIEPEKIEENEYNSVGNIVEEATDINIVPNEKANEQCEEIYEENITDDKILESNIDTPIITEETIVEENIPQDKLVEDKIEKETCVEINEVMAETNVDEKTIVESISTVVEDEYNTVDEKTVPEKINIGQNTISEYNIISDNVENTEDQDVVIPKQTIEEQTITNEDSASNTIERFEEELGALSHKLTDEAAIENQVDDVSILISECTNVEALEESIEERPHDVENQENIEEQTFVSDKSLPNTEAKTIEEENVSIEERPRDVENQENIEEQMLVSDKRLPNTEAKTIEEENESIEERPHDVENEENIEEQMLVSDKRLPNTEAKTIEEENEETIQELAATIEDNFSNIEPQICTGDDFMKQTISEGPPETGNIETPLDEINLTENSTLNIETQHRSTDEDTQEEKVEHQTVDTSEISGEENFIVPEIQNAEDSVSNLTETIEEITSSIPEAVECHQETIVAKEERDEMFNTVINDVLESALETIEETNTSIFQTGEEYEQEPITPNEESDAAISNDVVESLMETFDYASDITETNEKGTEIFTSTEIIENAPETIPMFEEDQQEYINQENLNDLKEKSEIDLAVSSIMMEDSYCIEEIEGFVLTEAEPEIRDLIPEVEQIDDAIQHTDTNLLQSEENNSRNTELGQPLTVEVEDPSYNEQDATEAEEIQMTEMKNSEIAETTEAPIPVVEGNQTNRSPLKMTITKHKTDNIHSILKIYDPNEIEETNLQPNIPKLIIKSTQSSSSTGEHYEQEYSIPKITIKPIVSSDSSHSPKLTIKPIKPPSEDEKSLSPLKMTIRSYSKLEEHLQQSSPKLNIKPVVKPQEEARHSPKITIKPIVKPTEDKHSPRITIKPIIKPPSEETEEKHKNNMRSSLKPQEDTLREEIQYEHERQHTSRITIKPIMKPAEEMAEERHCSRITIKPIVKPMEEFIQEEERNSPRITIKPVIKPLEETVKEGQSEERHSPRITIKPITKPMEETIRDGQSEERHSPRITIKPVIKPMEESNKEAQSEERHSPRITIKPIIKPPEEGVSEEKHSPRITIKPILKPSETENAHSPRITIKPVIKPPESEKKEEASAVPVQPFKLNIKPVVKPTECGFGGKVTIKPVLKPQEPDDESVELVDFEEQIKQERIVLKIAKNTKKEKENEKLKKIKLKFSKEGGLAHIVPSTTDNRKRSSFEESQQELKHFKADLPSDLTVSLISSTASPTSTPDVTITRVHNPKSSAGGFSIAPVVDQKPVTAALKTEDLLDPLAEIPVFEITLETAANMSSVPPQAAPPVPPVVVPPAPRKRGRPRKVPLEVRQEFKDPKEDEIPPVVEESTRPKRSCRGASVTAALGIKPRKPRAPSTRGRGGKKAAATRASAKKAKEAKTSAAKFLKDSILKGGLDFKDFQLKDAEFKQVPLPSELGNREVVIYEEETRMSAENSSRAQTPAKQVLNASSEVIEESQSSVQSSTTTESGEKIHKTRKGPRLEVHQEPEGEVISADKLAEYSWGGGGPYMLQEQVAQFLGIKSFKRKYPGIQRRPVDMQERDFIRESCLASEAMCDMGLTAVRSEDILDIMYTDFQHKYEEYCKHQRDRQAKDVSNKQKALSLAASQEKNKLDIVEQAVQSAFQWNANFNKTRKEQRRACMDLQTFTVHFPKGKMKQVNKPAPGHYPLALVPGQYTDHYKQYNSLELGNLPLNTIGCKPVSISSVNQDTEESQSDGSGSESDSSSSDSDSSYSGSSGAEDCKMCSHPASSGKKLLAH